MLADWSYSAIFESWSTSNGITIPLEFVNRFNKRSVKMFKNKLRICWQPSFASGGCESGMWILKCRSLKLLFGTVHWAVYDQYTRGEKCGCLPVHVSLPIHSHSRIDYCLFHSVQHMRWAKIRQKFCKILKPSEIFWRKRFMTRKQLGFANHLHS